MDIKDPRIDYLAMAKCMGLPARRVSLAGDIAAAIEAGIASETANLVEVVISAA